MKRNTLIAISVLSLAGVTSSTASSGVDDRRSAQEHRAFKGYELYSWQTANGEWRYALLVGTNRLKDWSELEKSALAEQELQRALGELARGESVTWCNREVAGQPPALVRPPKSTAQSLLDLARRHEVDLDLCEPAEPLSEVQKK